MLIYEPYVSNMYAILATCEWAKQLSRCLPRIKVGLGKSVNKQTVKAAAHTWKMAIETTIAKIRG